MLFNLLYFCKYLLHFLLLFTFVKTKLFIKIIDFFHYHCFNFFLAISSHVLKCHRFLFLSFVFSFSFFFPSREVFPLGGAVGTIPGYAHVYTTRFILAGLFIVSATKYQWYPSCWGIKKLICTFCFAYHGVIPC